MYVYMHSENDVNSCSQQHAYMQARGFGESHGMIQSDHTPQFTSVFADRWPKLTFGEKGQPAAAGHH